MRYSNERSGASIQNEDRTWEETVKIRPAGARGSRDSHVTIRAFGASRLASSDLQNKTGCIAV